jgi:superfamily II DNA or RNA helicase
MHTLERFAEGRLDFLIACDRISEGIDIKTVDTIVLFSCDQVRLQTIQRIGRALRTISSNKEKRARVIDFYFDEEGKEDSADMVRKDWLERLANIRRTK